MKKILISVIIPVYNVKKYINKCLDSVINQTYKNLEIILVDDVSTDGSGKICDEYAKKDKRIKVIHKENGGLSSARNAGIKVATGDYISFVDSDDYIDSKMLETLLYDIVNNDCEISVMNIFFVYDGIEKKCNNIVNSKVVSQREGLEYLFLKADTPSWNKLYKKSLFNGVEFPIGKIWEDVPTIPLLFLKANKIYLDSNYGYYYYQRKNSIINSKFSIKKLDFALNAKKICEDVKKVYDDMDDVLDSYYLMALTSVILLVYPERKKYKEEYKYLLDEIKKYKTNNKYISRSLKLKIFMSLNHMIWLLNIIKRFKNNNNLND